MQYKPYGNDGPDVSRLGFGVMRLPARRGGGWGSVNWSKSIPLLTHAMDQGVNFFDSHHFYHHGLSEEAIGRAIKRATPQQRERIVIQTKTPYYNAEKKQAWFKDLIEQALEKMNVECIDYLLFHSMSLEMFQKRGKGFLNLTDWAMKKGYVRRRGFSSHDTPENIRTLIETGEFSAMLLSYNWLNNQMRDVIAFGADKGMGVSVMNPVGGGLLATETRPIRRLLRSAHSAAEIAMRYVLDTPGVCTAMSGMNSIEQIDENVSIASRRRMLTDRQREIMTDRITAIRQKQQAICTACGYCMPCPAGVDIPGNFMLLQQDSVLGLSDFAGQRYTALKKAKDGDKSAAACKACGACLEKCPNHIPIIDQLAEVAERYE